MAVKDPNERWGHRWLTPRAEPKTSEVSGAGVVAKENIPKGAAIIVYGGIIVPKEEIKEYNESEGMLGIQVNEDFFSVPLSYKSDIKIGALNHSCNPNCGFDDTVTVVAMRDINAGEELTIDYAMMESDRFEFACMCKSENCRGKVTPEDWKIKELQKKYGQYFSPYLKKKFMKGAK